MELESRTMTNKSVTKKKILVIGSQGYLGSRLTEYLETCKYEVKGIDTGFFKGGELTKPHEISTLSKDVRLIGERELEGYTSVVLLAGISNDPFGNLTSEQIYDPTREYALRIATICKHMGIKFIFPSSCSVYGVAGKDFLAEQDATNPQTPYSLNKIQVEEGLSLLADDTFSPIALRFGTIYGFSPRIRFDVVINMLCGLALTTKEIILNSDGEAWRPHLHIEDACESIRCCIDWDLNASELMILNVGNNSDNYKIIDIAKIIHKHVKDSKLNFLARSDDDATKELVKDRKIQDGVDTRTYRVCFDKIHELLPGFKCHWNVEAGIINLLSELKRLKLESETFNKREFYRLQHIEHLYHSNQIDGNLFWIK